MKNVLSPITSEEKAKRCLAAQELLAHDFPGFFQQYKIGILLVIQDVKPISEMVVLDDDDEPQDENSIKARANKIKDDIQAIIKEVGVIVDLGIERQQQCIVFNYYFFKKREAFKKLQKVYKKLIEARSPAQVKAEFGEVFGYPKTAIEGCVQGRLIQGKHTHDELPDGLKATRVGQFYPYLSFGFSEDHWPDEAKVAEEWMHAIDEIAPGYLDNIPKDDWN